jgi:hypothetical protein
MNSAAKRFGAGANEEEAPQTDLDSSQGKAMVTPAPRRKVRRETDNGLACRPIEFMVNLA